MKLNHCMKDVWERIREWSAKRDHWLFSFVVATSILLASCNRKDTPRAAYVPITELEQKYGRVVGVANFPTPNQNGTGDRLGFFQDETGTIWGIGISVDDDGHLLGCAPPNLRELPVTDTLPADFSNIVGAANEPTGWRGGTGKLGVLFRDAKGELRWRAIAAGDVTSGPVCWSKSPPEQPLKYYRLVKAGTNK